MMLILLDGCRLEFICRWESDQELLLDVGLYWKYRVNK